MTTTPLRILADHLTGDLDRFVRDRRAGGESWRSISQALLDETGGQVDITHETLRRWFPDPS